MQNPLDLLAGYKTYIAGVGLIALAVFQLSVGDFVNAGQSFVTGLGLLFARRAVERNA